MQLECRCSQADACCRCQSSTHSCMSVHICMHMCKFTVGTTSLPDCCLSSISRYCHMQAAAAWKQHVQQQRISSAGSLDRPSVCIFCMHPAIVKLVYARSNLSHVQILKPVLLNFSCRWQDAQRVPLVAATRGRTSPTRTTSLSGQGASLLL